MILDYTEQPGDQESESNEEVGRNSVRGDRQVEGFADTEWCLPVASWSTVHKMLYLRLAQAPLYSSNHINDVLEAEGLKRMKCMPRCQAASTQGLRKLFKLLMG